MEEGALEESVQPEKQSESLKPFSDAELLEELGKRVGSNPKVDPVIVQKVQSIATELQKKAEVAKPLPVEPEKPAEVGSPAVDSKPENSAELVESEGKKWAKIIREKGAGFLYGKFNKNCKYYDDSGNEHYLNPQGGIGFTGVGQFTSSEKIRTGSDINTLGSQISKNVSAINSRYSQDGMKDPSNFLSIENTVIYNGKGNELSKERLEGWRTFGYIFFLDPSSTPDHRAPFLPITFYFALPQEESSQFGQALKKNADLIEDVFQNVYPGLTKEGGGMKRMMVNKVRVLLPNSREEIVVYGVSRLDKYRMGFSHPVGDIQWADFKTRLQT